MDDHYDTLRGYDRWHWLLALALLALLVVLPWLGMGPNSWRACGDRDGAQTALSTAEAGRPAGAAPDSAAPAEPQPSAPSAPSALTDATKPVAATPSAVLYFALDKYTLPSNSNEALAGVIDHLRANPDAKAQLVGFHDPTGRMSHNQELAKNRALTVRGALEQAGIASERLVLRRPADSTGTGSHERARRVEVTIIQ